MSVLQSIGYPSVNSHSLVASVDDTVIFSKLW
jgi:hypothetical protein